MPVEKDSPRREFRLEVRIGGEVFYQSVILSEIEIKGHPRFTSQLKTELVGRFLDSFKAQIYEQIGRH
jgi:hypothetical protein